MRLRMPFSLFIIGLIFLISSCPGYPFPTSTPDTLQDEVDLITYRLTMEAFPNESFSPFDTTEGIMLEGLLSYQGNNYQKAKGLFQKVIKFNETDPHAWYYYGMSSYHLNQSEEAMNAFNRTLEIDPEYYHAWYGKSLVYYHVGDIWAQSDAISTALEIEKKVSEKSTSIQSEGTIQAIATPDTPFPSYLILLALIGGFFTIKR